MMTFLYYWAYYLSLVLIGFYSTTFFVGLGELLDSIHDKVVVKHACQNSSTLTATEKE